ncbi:MAG: hypothetical protein HY909_30700 [Deltaproteobacteria bacterium]|nr:hypothetical protein [Deltaproteobacteria bacterium]
MKRAIVAGWVLATGCVVYRDRYVTVDQRVNVELRAGTSGAAGTEGAPRQTVTLPGTPGRLDLPALRAALDAYGAWLEDPGYGLYWRPRVEGSEGFVPYGTHGQWVPTDAGWFWQSTLPYGWVVFHYGRWAQLEGGWVWIPGSAFAPAWVEWRQGSGWVGWAPLGPVGVSYTAPYVYCNEQRLTGTDLWGRVVHGPAATSLYPRTRALTVAYGYGGTVYAWGPAASSAVAARVPLVEAWRGSVVPGGTVVTAPGPGPAYATGVAPVQEGRPVGIPEGYRLADIPTVVTTPIPATGERRMATAFVDTVEDTGGRRLRETVTLGTTVELPSATPSARVATWERYRTDFGSAVTAAPTGRPSGPTAVPSGVGRPSTWFAPEAPLTIAPSARWGSPRGAVPGTSLGGAGALAPPTSAPTAGAPVVLRPSLAVPSAALPTALPTAGMVTGVTRPTYVAPSVAAPVVQAAPTVGSYGLTGLGLSPQVGQRIP